MTKITNKDVIKATGMTQREFYYMKKNSPHVVLIMKKGLIADAMIKESFFEGVIKPDNKKG